MDNLREEIENILDKYKSAVDRMVCAEVDAGACQTKSDYRRRDEARETEDKVRDESIAALIKLFEDELRWRNVQAIPRQSAVSVKSTPSQST